MATKYVDNRLTTGANDGTSAANAFRSLFDAEVGTVGSGDTVEVIAGSGPYYEATSVNATLRVYGTDISFNSGAKTITTAGAVSFTAYNTPGNIIRIQGSQSNDGQYTIASATATVITLSATNNLVTESAGNRIRVVDITSTTNSANRSFVHDPGRNGTSATVPLIWNFNNCEVSAGLDLGTDRYKWNQSASNTNEWYVTRADGSNPSLNKPDSGVVNGNFMCASAGDLIHKRGTAGSLSFSGQYGYGDTDSLGFNTVYVRSPQGNPQTTLGWSLRFGQIYTCFYQVWGSQQINKCRYSFGNGAADGNASGCCVQARGLNLTFRKCVFMYADGHGFEASANGPFLLEQCIGYWTGHRFFTQGNTAAITTTIVGCVDWGAHLFALIGASVGSGSVVKIFGCISANNEAGAIDRKVGSAGTLIEAYNCWYPRMTAAGGALGYVSPTMWPYTAPTDLPNRMATTENDQTLLNDPMFVATSDSNFDDCDFSLQDGSPCLGRGMYFDPARTQLTDINDVTFTHVLNMGVDQEQRNRPYVT